MEIQFICNIMINVGSLDFVKTFGSGRDLDAHRWELSNNKSTKIKKMRTKIQKKVMHHAMDNQKHWT